MFVSYQCGINMCVYLMCVYEREVHSRGGVSVEHRGICVLSEVCGVHAPTVG